jgi:E3 ubiquitin-protein ligase SHPRH
MTSYFVHLHASASLTIAILFSPSCRSALDKQAINRIHRIGQTKRTFVWRYLIENTIEMKLDRMRLSRDDKEVLEDTLNSSRKKTSLFSAGGIDGGFNSHEDLLEILNE